jgi:hypothetical protein
MLQYRDTEWGRRKYLASLTVGKVPSTGLMNLAHAIKNKVFRIVLTTNLEVLLEIALRKLGVEPLVLAHDEPMPKRILNWDDIDYPIIIKLHSDFLWSPANLDRETETRVNENTVTKLKPLFEQYGLIVIGYSGEDKSIMQVFNNFAGEPDCFPHGLYWLYRSTSHLNENVKGLLTKNNRSGCEIVDADSFFTKVLVKHHEYHSPNTPYPVVRRLSPDGINDIEDKINDLKSRYTTIPVPADAKHKITKLEKELEEAKKKTYETAAALLGLYQVDTDTFKSTADQYRLDLLSLALRQPEAFWVAEIDGHCVGYLSMFRMTGHKLFEVLVKQAKEGTLDLPKLTADYWDDIDKSRSEDDVRKMEDLHFYIDAIAVPEQWRKGVPKEPVANTLIDNVWNELREIIALADTVATIAVNPDVKNLIMKKTHLLKPSGKMTNKDGLYRKLFVFKRKKKP